ncbi:MAG: hypothetical protein M0T85_06100 [Dehalococcoidales bacterium]|nr:hypothetical protein [Dehalococcoidales bacterium]
MRRFAAIVAAVVVGIISTTGLAMADGGPHGDYTATTDKCAACHRAHSGLQAKLLDVAGTITDFCYSCHGTGNVGANTNVQDGLYQSTRQSPYSSSSVPDAPLNGGGFSYASVKRTWGGSSWSVPISGTVSSKHTLDTDGQKIWGSGASDSALTAMKLTCTSCHDPHGTNTYRLTKTLGSPAVSVPWTDEGSPTKSYTTLPWTSGVASAFNMSNWCSACHTRYYATPNSAGVGSVAQSDSKYRHRIDFTVAPSSPAQFILPLAGSTDQRLVCLTCHVPHGTNTSMTGYASTDYSRPDNTATQYDNASNPSVLLRLDNRGVCENCHRKDPSGW